MFDFYFSDPTTIVSITTTQRLWPTSKKLIINIRTLALILILSFQFQTTIAQVPQISTIKQVKVTSILLAIPTILTILMGKVSIHNCYILFYRRITLRNLRIIANITQHLAILLILILIFLDPAIIPSLTTTQRPWHPPSKKNNINIGFLVKQTLVGCYTLFKYRGINRT